MAKSNTGKIEGHQARSADQRALVFGAGVSEVVKQNRIGSFCSPSFGSQPQISRSKNRRLVLNSFRGEFSTLWFSKSLESRVVDQSITY